MNRTAAIVARLETEADHLDVSPILAIHRGKDGYIGFVRKPATPSLDKQGRPRQFEQLFSIKVSELREMFPTVASLLVQDSYFTVNSMYRAAPYPNRLTGLPDVWRREEHLKYLNTCYTDLDVGRPESENPEQRQTWRQAAAAAGDLMDEGHLPQASIFARSGRGVYIFWLLHDEGNPNLPPIGDAKYHPEKLALYKLVNKELGRRLQHLAADRAAHDGARVLRVPGTRHGKTHQHATFQVTLDDRGRGYSYTLSDLALRVGIVETAESLPAPARQMSLVITSTPRGRETKAKGTAPNKLKGRISLNARRAQDLVTIEQHRQGWVKQHPCGRRFHLDLYARFLHGSGTAPQDILAALKVMAANCRPPYPSDPNDTPLAKILEGVTLGPPKIYTDASLCKWLLITPDLARELNLLTILPPEVRAERTPPPGGHRQQLTETRRAFIQEWVNKHGIPRGACRAFVRILDTHGIPTNRQTVADDLIALGYPHQGRGRPKVGR